MLGRPCFAGQRQRPHRRLGRLAGSNDDGRAPFPMGSRERQAERAPGFGQQTAEVDRDIALPRARQPTPGLLLGGDPGDPATAGQRGPEGQVRWRQRVRRQRPQLDRGERLGGLPALRTA